MIVMDRPRTALYRGKTVRTAHLCSTIPGDAGRAEFVAFATSIKLAASWLQKPPGKPEHEHYDVFNAMCEAAMKAGARVLGRDEIVAVWAAKREGREHVLGPVTLTLEAS